jgi:hypothetical protein
VNPNPDWIRIQLGPWIRIQEGKNDPEKYKTVNTLLRAEGFSCSLGVLYEGLGISKLQVLIIIRRKKYLLYFFLKFLVIKTLDPDSEPGPDSLELLDPDLDPQHCPKLHRQINRFNVILKPPPSPPPPSIQRQPAHSVVLTIWKNFWMTSIVIDPTILYDRC